MFIYNCFAKKIFLKCFTLVLSVINALMVAEHFLLSRKSHCFVNEWRVNLEYYETNRPLIGAKDCH